MKDSKGKELKMGSGVALVGRIEAIRPGANVVGVRLLDHDGKDGDRINVSPDQVGWVSDPAPEPAAPEAPKG